MNCGTRWRRPGEGVMTDRRSDQARTAAQPGRGQVAGIMERYSYRRKMNGKPDVPWPMPFSGLSSAVTLGAGGRWIAVSNEPPARSHQFQAGDRRSKPNMPVLRIRATLNSLVLVGRRRFKRPAERLPHGRYHSSARSALVNGWCSAVCWICSPALPPCRYAVLSRCRKQP